MTTKETRTRWTLPADKHDELKYCLDDFDEGKVAAFLSEVEGQCAMYLIARDAARQVDKQKIIKDLDSAIKWLKKAREPIARLNAARFNATRSVPEHAPADLTGKGIRDLTSEAKRLDEVLNEEVKRYDAIIAAKRRGTQGLESPPADAGKELKQLMLDDAAAACDNLSFSTAWWGQVRKSWSFITQLDAQIAFYESVHDAFLNKRGRQEQHHHVLTTSVAITYWDIFGTRPAATTRTDNTVSDNILEAIFSILLSIVDPTYLENTTNITRTINKAVKAARIEEITRTQRAIDTASRVTRRK